ncbi:hypothetical protein BLNAU_12317 [Blattamonas nauphoetae]|uniref:Uncharacterized protein n=1 Tax=Blattamonas nauphoetae TaxID=2049346 RepID=A0ABQ9XMV9_9EUKA|nr:hypothetical protein BLNAU_12317 [Blattamonas nauphoetae]
MSTPSVCSKKSCTDTCYLCGGKATASIHPIACGGCKAQYKQTCLVCKSRRSGSAAGRLCGKCQSKKHQGTCTLCGSKC